MVREVGFVDRCERYCVQQQQIALRDGSCDIITVVFICHPDLIEIIIEPSESNLGSLKTTVRERW